MPSIKEMYTLGLYSVIILSCRTRCTLLLSEMTYQAQYYRSMWGGSFVKTETRLQLYFIISFFYLRVTVNVIFLVIVVKLFIKQVNCCCFFDCFHFFEIGFHTPPPHTPIAQPE